jgi:hypothetical protein
MEKYNIDRDRVRTLLARAPKAKHRNERHLCEKMGITPPTFWRRCRDNAWKMEAVIGLAVCLSEISGDPCEADELIVRAGTQGNF